MDALVRLDHFLLRYSSNFSGALLLLVSRRVPPLKSWRERTCFPGPRDANHLGRRSALQLLESPHVGMSLGSMNSIKRYQFEHQGAYRRCLKSASPQRRAEKKWGWSREVGRNKPRFWGRNSKLQPDVVDPKETHHLACWRQGHNFEPQDTPTTHQPPGKGASIRCS